jgi:hypothetical protein
VSDYAYEIPRQNTSAEQAEKYAHADLSKLSEVELWREEKRLEFVLAWEDRAHPWLWERLSRVKGERAKRQKERRDASDTNGRS